MSDPSVSATAPNPPSNRAFDRAVSGALKAIWCVVVPALVAAAALRFFLPDAAHAESDALSQFLAQAKASAAIPLGAIVFLASAFVLRYWQRYLPGADLLGAPARVREASLGGWWVLGVVGLAALFVRSSVFASYRIASASMLPNLEQNDVVAVNKLAFGLKLPLIHASVFAKPPRRGDVIVFEKPAGVEGPPELIKRVVGLPGDVISMRRGHVSINGWEAPSCDLGPYVYVSKDYSEITRGALEFLEGHVYLTIFAPDGESWPVTFKVPEGQVFVLGDNRSSSEDSRAWDQGKGAGLPLGLVEGRASRVLVGTLRNGVADMSQVWKPMDWYNGKPLNLEGMNTKDLRAAVDNCLKNPPKGTTPPGHL